MTPRMPSVAVPCDSVRDYIVEHYRLKAEIAAAEAVLDDPEADGPAKDAARKAVERITGKRCRK